MKKTGKRLRRAAALLLTLIVLVLSIVGRMITHRFSKNKIK